MKEPKSKGVNPSGSAWSLGYKPRWNLDGLQTEAVPERKMRAIWFVEAGVSRSRREKR